MHSKQKKTQKTTASSIRIIGGQWRGRKLTVPHIDGLRPTGDRIRETLFNWLMPYTSGSRCLDVFAGTGALGLEALSRGAANVQFAELNREAAQQLHNNLKTLGCDNAEIFRGDALKRLSTPSEPVDIVFLDPPFAADLWQQSLDLLVANHWLKAETLIYIESPKTTRFDLPAGWHCHREKTTGAVRYALYQSER